MVREYGKLQNSVIQAWVNELFVEGEFSDIVIIDTSMYLFLGNINDETLYNVWTGENSDQHVGTFYGVCPECDGYGSVETIDNPCEYCETDKKHGNRNHCQRDWPKCISEVLTVYCKRCDYWDKK